jgi:hypothetical protein
MGRLYDACQKVTAELKRDRGVAEQTRLRGEIALRVGYLVTLVGPSEADDPTRIQALKLAAADVLGIYV